MVHAGEIVIIIGGLQSVMLKQGDEVIRRKTLSGSNARLHRNRIRFKSPLFFGALHFKFKWYEKHFLLLVEFTGIKCFQCPGYILP